MPKSSAQLDREIAESLARRKREAKFLQGRRPQKSPKTSGARRASTVSPAASRTQRSSAPTPTRKATVSKPRFAKIRSTVARAAKPGTFRTAAPRTFRTAASTSAKTRLSRRLAHATATSEVDIDELIASDDPEDWSVARDYAIEQDDQELLVQLEMARALDVSPSDIKVTEGRPYDESFEVHLGRNREYVVVPDEDTAREIAVARVTEDLENEPEMFNASFIESHIDDKKLKKYVYDVRMEDDYVGELASRQPRDFWRLADQLGLSIERETDEDGDELDPTDEQVDEVKEAYAQQESENPMEFFRDHYGDEAAKYAIEAVGIDVAAAAEEAVNSDGWEHFLAHYDGKSGTTDTGLVYFRTN